MSYSHWMRRHRRNIGIPLLLAALYLARFDAHYLWISIAVVATGELLRLWAAGHLQKEQVLTTGGPYRRLRNPLYLGSFLIAIGFCLIAGSVWVWILVVAYFLFCYLPVVRFEEQTLQKKFGKTFQEYAQAVPAFAPALWPFPYPSTTFSWRQVAKNKEYAALIGILTTYLYLVAVNPNLHP